eukprot:NODE_24160_length_636_cov_3.451866.p1 GENE.NODE_24160_length_636_cov_3.451866~~NODE_24160_length_636_cov_3.451866.p1  ORF type:complete len:89 (-),score=26.77 NODE_24160_length_636_cov_3.451866:302-568(-)
MQTLVFDPKQEETNKMFGDDADDGSGTIEHMEFLKMMTFKILNRIPKEEILKVVELFTDEDKWNSRINFKKPAEDREGTLRWTKNCRR